MTPISSLNRRQALGAGLAATAALAVGSQAVERPALAKDESTPRWIDAHSHIWTRDVKTFPLAQGQSVADLDPPSFTAEELLEVAQPEGVERVVLIQHHIYHGWDNSYLVDAAQRFPGKFRVVGMVDDAQPHPDVRMRELLKQQVTGFRITPSIRGRDQWLDGPGMTAMWKIAAETRQAICCLIDPADLPAVDKMCGKHPDTVVVIDHFARIGVDGQIRDADVTALCQLARHPRTHVKLSAYYALGKKRAPYDDLVPMIRRVSEAFGRERVMWASDAPYQMQGEHTYRASIAVVRDQLPFLSTDDRQWWLRKTAERVFFFNA